MEKHKPAELVSKCLHISNFNLYMFHKSGLFLVNQIHQYLVCDYCVMTTVFVIEFQLNVYFETVDINR